jgi:hypothetical protein
MNLRRLAIALVLLSGLASTACTERSGSVLTLEGTYSGTTSESCQLAVRVASSQALVESHEVPASFHQDFDVPANKERYSVEVHCPDGKVGFVPALDFEPPRQKVTLNEIQLN